MTSFTNIFFGALESVICRVLSAYGLHDVAMLMDRVMLFVIPGSFTVLYIYFSLKAILSRNKSRKVAEEESINSNCGSKGQLAGVARSLLVENVEDVESVALRRDKIWLVEEKSDCVGGVEGEVGVDVLNSSTNRLSRGVDVAARGSEMTKIVPVEGQMMPPTLIGSSAMSSSPRSLF